MKRNNPFISFLHFVNTYSLWVAIGSFSTFLFFSSVFSIPYDYWVASGLGLAVWIVYTLDHFLDGYKLKNAAIAPRHKAHFTQSKAIFVLLTLASIILCYVSLNIEERYFSTIAVLGVFTIAHFIINFIVSERIKKKFFLKEVFIAFVVTIGFVLLPLSGTLGYNLPSRLSFYFATVFMLNLANLVIFSWYDRALDLQTKTLSIASIYSPVAIRFLVYFSLIISLGYAAALIALGSIGVTSFVIILLMQGTLLVVISFPSYFGMEDRYRFYGDLIYVYPLVAMPFL